MAVLEGRSSCIVCPWNLCETLMFQCCIVQCASVARCPKVHGYANNHSFTAATGEGVGWATNWPWNPICIIKTQSVYLVEASCVSVSETPLMNTVNARTYVCIHTYMWCAPFGLELYHSATHVNLLLLPDYACVPLVLGPHWIVWALAPLRVGTQIFTDWLMDRHMCVLYVHNPMLKYVHGVWHIAYLVYYVHTLCMLHTVCCTVWCMVHAVQYIHIMALVWCSAASIPLCAQVLNQFNMTPDMWENAIKQCWSENHCRLARYVLLRGVSTYVCMYSMCDHDRLTGPHLISTTHTQPQTVTAYSHNMTTLPHIH